MRNLNLLLAYSNSAFFRLAFPPPSQPSFSLPEQARVLLQFREVAEFHSPPKDHHTPWCVHASPGAMNYENASSAVQSDQPWRNPIPTLGIWAFGHLVIPQAAPPDCRHFPRKYLI